MNTFRIGGIHPKSNKLSAGQPVQILPPPGTVIIPLSQHIGAPASAVVAKGDKVKVGTLIGRAEGTVSANVHSSVSGTVTKVDNVTDGFGLARPAVCIQTEGDEWEPAIDRSTTLIKEHNLTSEEIISKIDAAGIVGMGGAAFPCKVKLTPPSGSKAEILIINGAECEPYLTADHALMIEKSEEILVGVTLLMKAINVQRAVIGIEDDTPDAIAQLKKFTPGYPGIEIVTLKKRYPQGGEKQLIDAIVRRQVKSGALPVSVGAIVINIGTTYAVYEAVCKNKPLFERIVTLSGKNVAKPSNFLVRIGTPIDVLIETAGGLPEDTGKILIGGPMMGKAIINTQAPVTKGCSGIVLLKKEESVRRPMHNCIRCAKCIEACPMGLEPCLLMNITERNDWEEARQNHITDCIECGSCAYSCPANRPLYDYIRHGKMTVLGMKKSK